MNWDKDFIKWITPSFNRILVCQKNLELDTFKQVNCNHHKRIRIDYLAQNKNGCWVAIEFEDGDTFGKITKGIAQLEDFYNMLKDSDIQHLTPQDQLIEPKYFVLATQYSKEGHLYKNDKRIIPCGGYSQEEQLHKHDWTTFCLTRMMWRLCCRSPYSDTNPIATSCFSIISKSWDGEPEIEINGKTKIKLKNLK